MKHESLEEYSFLLKQKTNHAHMTSTSGYSDMTFRPSCSFLPENENLSLCIAFLAMNNITYQ